MYQITSYGLASSTLIKLLLASNRNAAQTILMLVLLQG